MVESLTGGPHAGEKLTDFVAAGEELLISSLVLYEWLRGPRTSIELLDRERLFPDAKIVRFGAAEASRAAEIYRRVPRGRSREIDIAIAATAIVHDAPLWTLNPADFEDVPGLKLV